MIYFEHAKDLFLAARDARREIDITSLQLKYLSESRLSLGGIHEGQVVKSTGDDFNKTSKSNSYLDFVDIAKERISKDEELINYALQVLYGSDGNGGLKTLLHVPAADVIRLRFIEDRTWDSVTIMATVSRNTAKSYINMAFELIDCYGIERVRQGEGVAETL